MAVTKAEWRGTLLIRSCYQSTVCSVLAAWIHSNEVSFLLLKQCTQGKFKGHSELTVIQARHRPVESCYPQPSQVLFQIHSARHSGSSSMVLATHGRSTFRTSGLLHGASAFSDSKRMAILAVIPMPRA